MNDPREAKLPRWAQALLHKERTARQEAQVKLAEHLETVEQTRISYGSYGNPVYIPDEFGLQTVRFDLGHTPNGSIYDQISVGLRKDHDDVRYVEVYGGHSIVIEPRASNVVRIYHGD